MKTRKLELIDLALMRQINKAITSLICVNLHLHAFIMLLFTHSTLLPPCTSHPHIQAVALSRGTQPTSTTSNSEMPTSPPSSLLTQLQEDLKNAQETRADMKKELQHMQEAEKQSGEALQRVNDSELQRLQQVRYDLKFVSTSKYASPVVL